MALATPVLGDQPNSDSTEYGVRLHVVAKCAACAHELKFVTMEEEPIGSFDRLD